MADFNPVSHLISYLDTIHTAAMAAVTVGAHWWEPVESAEDEAGGPRCRIHCQPNDGIRAVNDAVTAFDRAVGEASCMAPVAADWVVSWFLATSDESTARAIANKARDFPGMAAAVVQGLRRRRAENGRTLADGPRQEAAEVEAEYKQLSEGLRKLRSEPGLGPESRCAWLTRALTDVINGLNEEAPSRLNSRYTHPKGLDALLINALAGGTVIEQQERFDTNNFRELHTIIHSRDEPGMCVDWFVWDQVGCTDLHKPIIAAKVDRTVRYLESWIPAEPERPTRGDQEARTDDWTVEVMSVSEWNQAFGYAGRNAFTNERNAGRIRAENVGDNRQRVRVAVASLNDAARAYLEARRTTQARRART